MAVEIQFPYTVPPGRLAAACREAGVECVLINMPAGQLDAGELGLACLPGREEQFAEAVSQAISYAQTLNCRRVNCLGGKVPESHSRERCWDVLVANTRLAAGRLADAGIQLLVEPLNATDIPGFILSKISDGDELLAAVDHSNLALQYDVYHRRAAEEDWLGGLEQRCDRIGHIQFSDFPGRHEPGTGELTMERLFDLVERLPYQGWTGCEYRPTGTTEESFAWRKALLARRRA
jgi:hydroxypyruvate isomerase